MFFKTTTLTQQSEVFKTLSEDEQCSLLTAIGEAACSDARSLSSQGSCVYCDSGKLSKIAPMSKEFCADLLLFMNSLQKTLHEQKLPRTRVAAMVSLNRLLAHINNPVQLDLSKSPLKQWCFHSLKSSIRDLRIAAM